MHGVPRNSKAKSFPSPTPASLGPELPKRKAHEQPYARVPRASPAAVFETHHPLPSPRGCPSLARRCPRARRDPLPAVWPCARQAQAGTRTRGAQVVGSRGSGPPLLRGESSAALPLHQRTTRKLGRSGFSLRCFGTGDTTAFVGSLMFAAVWKYEIISANAFFFITITQKLWPA